MIAAVILAAGLSRRMGQAKLLMLLDGRAIVLIGRSALIRNKRATGRPKDLVDADALEKGR